jgi:hypothetical protein
MKRIAALALIALLAACGGDAGPTDRFSGTWTGAAVNGPDTLHLVLMSAQTGSTITGTGTATEAASSAALTFTGTSTPPTMNLLIISPFDSATFTGTYGSSNSIVGVITGGGMSLALTLTKQ